jgi:hypothetical protein
MSAKDTGLTFLEQVLAHVPADKQAAVREALATSDAALTELGAATMRQSDYSRGMDTLKEQQAATAAWKEQLDGWFATNQARLAATESATPNPNPAAPAITTPAFDASKYISREDVATALAEKENQFVNALAYTSTLAARHLFTFQEPLDLPALMKNPEISSLGIDGVYQKVYAERLAAKAKEADDKAFDARYQARLAEERKANPQMPYPVFGQPNREPTPLDAIEASYQTQAKSPTGETITPVMSVVEKAIQDYDALVAQRR